MAVNPETRIIIRHLSGSKINQVEQIPLKDLHEVTIGRDPNASIAYDQRRDDVVSREHALIRVEGGEHLNFRLLDLNSSNGTLLNGEPISGEVELVPEDIVELGRGGPKFTFDVKPRPDNLTSRTRVIDAIDASATRAMATVTSAGTGTKEMVASAPAGTKELATAAVRTRDGERPAKVAVGKDTVLRMLSQERKNTSRVWMSSLAAVLVVLALGGVGLYWHNTAIAKRLHEEAAQKGQELLASASTTVSQQLGLMAKDIHDKFENTTVYIEVQWRLYDKGTGKPLFHKVFLNEKNESIPAFVKLPNGTVVRWLTLEDENRKNLPIMDSMSGSGFVVGEQGFIFTNKHVAAGWMLPYSDIGQGPKNPSNIGLVFPYRMQFPKNKQEKKDFLKNEFVQSLNELQALQNWVPEEGALVFDPGSATYIGGDVDNRRVFIGHNEVLDVRFPGNRMSMASTLVRASTDADVALVKVEAAQGLKVAELSQDDKLEVGEKVIVLGYPGVSEKTYIVMETRENGRSSRRQELVPEPTVTEGIISRLGSAVRKEGQATVVGTVEDAFQLSVNATGAGNSGGPVFNTKGQVIGLFTYGRNYGGASVSFAVPISHGRALLQPQRTD
jgi:S1-C subfamily serine protease/pSer/pThr/pTyr-binding forkhead associated (FHA) protein